MTPSPDKSVWIFGYGSLIFRPSFHFTCRAPGTIRGYWRRFWQESRDHRGTDMFPGRVVTLVPDSNGHCAGVAYRLSLDHQEEILAALDIREQGGYRRIEIEVELDGGDRVEAITYYGDSTNPNYVGNESLEKIAQIARTAHGPSGSNCDYILKLDAALTEMGVQDPHVHGLAMMLQPGS